MAPIASLRASALRPAAPYSTGLSSRRTPINVTHAVRSYRPTSMCAAAQPFKPTQPSKPEIQLWGISSPLPMQRPAERKVAASAGKSAPVVAASTTAEPESNVFKAVIYIALWYAFNIVFNILNKQALNTFPCPYFMSAMQLVVSGLWMCGLWVLKIQPAPKVDAGLIKQLAPVALAHTVGHVTACVSFSMMAVSFAHIVKSAEPVFSVALSGPFLGQWAPAYVWLSLLPIVAGCSLSAMKELSFAWGGFLFAMGSNLGMVFRNILSKKCLTDVKDRNLDGINLFALLSIISCAYCIPLALVMESSKWGVAWDAAVAAVGQTEFLKLHALSGIFYHLYNQLSYMVLGQGLSPTSFSVSNTMKRVAVVVTSVLFFKNPVTALNWLGSGIAIFGTFLYSLACQKQKADAAKDAAAKAPEAPASDDDKPPAAEPKAA